VSVGELATLSRLDYLQLVLLIMVGLHIVELAVIGIAAAWSVQVVRNDQRRVEREWNQVLQLLAHAHRRKSEAE
jgi:hypothetical protein